MKKRPKQIFVRPNSKHTGDINVTNGGPSPASTTRAQNETNCSIRRGIARLTKVATGSSTKLMPNAQILNSRDRSRIMPSYRLDTSPAREPWRKA